jgi:predicted dehydrogenase
MRDKIKFSVIGFGHIGKRHARIIAENPNTELISITDIDEGQKEEFDKLDYKVPFYKSIDSFLEHDHGTSDVVCICTPNGLHAELAIKALENGYHTVIEKPMALSRKDCESIIHASLQVSKQVFVVKQNRYSPPSKWLKQIVEEGILGNIQMVQINCYWNRDDRYYKPGGWRGTLAMDGGSLFTQFSHFLDIMYWIFGDIENIHADVKNFTHKHSIEFEDSGTVHFDFVEGGMGCINYSTSCWDQNMESSITVLGDKGDLKIGGQYMNEIEYCHIKDYEKPELEETNPPNDYGPYKGSAANHHYVFQNVVETLNGDGSITANALEGMKVVDIIERIYKHREVMNPTPSKMVSL